MAIRALPCWFVATLLLTVLGSCSTNTFSGEGGLELSDRMWLELYAKGHNTPVYAGPDRSSRVLYRLGMGRAIEVRRDPTEISAATRRGWIHIDRDESMSVVEEDMRLVQPSGWLRLTDFFLVSDFAPVGEWPFQYLIEHRYPFVVANCFSKDGNLVRFVRGEGQSERIDKRLFIAGDLVAVGNKNETYKGAGVLGYWDRGSQRLCPAGLSMNQCRDFYLNKDAYGFEWYVGRFGEVGNEENKRMFRLYCAEHSED